MKNLGKGGNHGKEWVAKEQLEREVDLKGARQSHS